MRVFSFLLVLAAAAAVAPAQVTTVDLPSSGCRDGNDRGAPVTSAGGQPVVDNFAFALQHQCPGSANAVFFLWGTCAPLINWPMSDPCFAHWTAPPSACQIYNGHLFYLDGDIAGGARMTLGGLVTWPFPMPDLRPGLDLAQISLDPPGWCMHFVCINLSNGRCTGASQAALVRYSNP